MKKILSLILAVLAAFTALGVQPARAIVNIIYVNDDVVGGATNGTSWANAYRKLQNALAAASSGDQIWVAAGIYYPDEGAAQTNDLRGERFELVNGVAIYGGFDTADTLLTDRNPSVNITILSGDIDQNDTNTDGNNIAENASHIQGNNAYNVVTGIFPAVDSATILDGFVITAGKADGSPLQSTTVGGGVRLLSGNSPTLANLIISGNSALASGGGMFNSDNSNPALTNVMFIGNTANNGGGMDNQNSDPSLTDVTFDGNSADYGGGMNNETGSSPVLTNVIFNGNSAGTNGGGGGMTVSSDSAPSLTNVTFSGNSAGVGGGMYLIALSNPYLTNVTFSGNSANNSGGGIYMAGGMPGPAYITVNNSTFSDNHADDFGGGVYSSLGDVLLRNVTFSGNSAGVTGGGIYNTNTTAAYLDNTLIGNSVGGDCVNVGGSGGTALKSLIEDSSNACGHTNGVDGNIIGSDPMLGPLQNNGGFTETHNLLSGSPAINTGTNSSCPTTDDQRGLARPQGGICDIGAIEIEILSLLLNSQGANDGWILESTETSGNGGTMNSAASLIYLGDNAVKKQYRSVLSFNTAPLPNNAVITKVTLKLKQQGIAGGGNPIAIFQGFVSDVRPGSFGGAPLALGDFKTAASKTVGPASPALTAGWYTLNLTPAKGFINKLAIGGGLTQIRLRFKLDDNNNATANFLKIYSGNAGVINRPKLIVEYYVP